MRMCKVTGWGFIKLGAMAAFLVGCAAPGALATDTFTLTGANPDGNNNGGVYVSPYTATITDASKNSVYSGDVICDDFVDDVTVGETWQVTSSPASSMGGDGLFQNGVTLSWNNDSYSNQQAYDALAWLAIQLLGIPLNNGSEQALYSYAIWAVFEPSALSPSSPYHYTGNTTDVENLINTAFAQNYSGAGVTVWTPSPNVGPGNKGPQEFLTVTTPEGSALTILAANLLGLIALGFIYRRRIPMLSR